MTRRVNNRRGDGDLLRAQLLEAATALLVAPRLVDPPSLRAIARASGVAPSAVYLHFDSAADLLGTVIAAQYDELRHALDAADDPAADPLERLALLADAYVGWGLGHPGAYQLLFESADVLPPPPEHGPDSPASAVEAGPGDLPAVGPGLDLLDKVADLVDLAGTRPEPGAETALEIWAALHGLVSLRLHKQEAPWLRDATGDAHRVVTALTAPNR
jgi:AcrR family transcriptional regulator